MQQSNKIVIITCIAIVISLLLYCYFKKDKVELKPIYTIDTHKIDSLQLKIDSITNSYNKLKEQSNNEKTHYITIRDSIINLNDTLKAKYITNYISQYKSFQY